MAGLCGAAWNKLSLCCCESQVYVQFYIQGMYEKAASDKVHEDGLLEQKDKHLAL